VIVITVVTAIGSNANTIFSKAASQMGSAAAAQ
jgi:Flp pilus assembly pilin Flp